MISFAVYGSMIANTSGGRLGRGRAGAGLVAAAAADPAQPARLHGHQGAHRDGARRDVGGDRLRGRRAQRCRAACPAGCGWSAAWSPGWAPSCSPRSACSSATWCRRRTSCSCSARRWRCWPCWAASSCRSTSSASTLQDAREVHPGLRRRRARPGRAAGRPAVDAGAIAQRRRLDGAVRRRRDLAVPPGHRPGLIVRHTARRDRRTDRRGRRRRRGRPAVGSAGTTRVRWAPRGSAGCGPPSGWSTSPSRSATAWRVRGHRRPGWSPSSRWSLFAVGFAVYFALDARAPHPDRRAAAVGRVWPVLTAMVAAARHRRARRGGGRRRRRRLRRRHGRHDPARPAGAGGGRCARRRGGRPAGGRARLGVAGQLRPAAAAGRLRRVRRRSGARSATSSWPRPARSWSSWPWPRSGSGWPATCTTSSATR